MENLTSEGTVSTILVIVAIAVIAVALVFFVLRLTAFENELRYLNIEIRRTDGKERKYWKKKRKKLWLSWLPFFKY